MPASYTLIPAAAIATTTPTALAFDAPSFAYLTSVQVVTVGEGSGTTAPTANPAAATVKNVSTMPAAPGATEFDFDTATNNWQYGAASGKQATGWIYFVLQGFLQGELPQLS